MKTIVILMDSLSRRFLPVYGGSAHTPSIDRLAAKSCAFDRHFVGSAPCMPARHDLLTGRIDFLERGWAPIQPFDETLPDVLRASGVFSHMCTDHYHYFHIGGENYHSVFSSWEFIRGQEHDTMVSDLGAISERAHYGNYARQYERNRATFATEADYPSPKTLAHAAEWVEQHHADDDWLLFVDSFDPHEPYDLPDALLEDDPYEDKLFYWPPYAQADSVPAEALSHARRRYQALIEMSDRWLGRLLDVLDRRCLWEDTMVVLTTDHGFMLGEKNRMGKNYMPAYNEVYHIPLLVHLPGMDAPSRQAALTQNIDLFPTILAWHGIEPNTCRNRLHGRSLLDLARGEGQPVHDAIIYGMFGRQVNVTDGRHTYFRAAANADNLPLHVYTAMPTTINHYWDCDHLTDVRRIEAGRFLTWTDYPVFRIPADITKLSDFSHSFDKRYEAVRQSLLFDLDADPMQEHPLSDPALEARMCRKLRAAMEACDSPAEQYTRLGLT